MASHRAVRALEAALAEDGADADVEGRRLWWFLAAESELEARGRLEATLERAALTRELSGEPSYRVWNETRHRYVSPGTPGVDPDDDSAWFDSGVAPHEITWRV